MSTSKQYSNTTAINIHLLIDIAFDSIGAIITNNQIEIMEEYI